MSTFLLDDESVRVYLQEHLASREWWTLVWGNYGAYVGQAIEAKYYAGEASADFRLLITPIFGMPCIAFAHKRRMTAKQLRRILASQAGIRLRMEQLTKQDVVFLAEGPDDPVILNAMVFLYQNRPDDSDGAEVPV